MEEFYVSFMLAMGLVELLQRNFNPNVASRLHKIADEDAIGVHCEIIVARLGVDVKTSGLQSVVSEYREMEEGGVEVDYFSVVRAMNLSFLRKKGTLQGI
uniref:Uncharacterized protein n=1 Tax=Chenopodium quinoa TaxID=63459 RepID=A0A803LTC5_CHEQI